MNLAPWYYRNIADSKNGVVENIFVSEVILEDGSPKWQSVVSLKNQFIPSWLEKSKIYGSSDGTGTSSFKNTAIHKSISEAIERWAFYSLANSNCHGFDIDLSTTGMAAFPSITYEQSRIHAKLEALERWSLCAFWRSNLPIIKHSSDLPNLEHYEIKTGENNAFVSLLVLIKNERSYFGFAAGSSLEISYHRAMIELSRNVKVLASFENMIELDIIFDKRLHFFSTKEGLELFYSKIQKSPFNVKETPRLVCDEKIIGEWTKFAKVWRCLYYDSSSDDNDTKFFLF